ncbi:hypothetical protein AB0D57_24540 [Streptomyces sp. NPDC048275]|uniref:hypothetical protein n=1 Tax=Streptomyces sp. NPDC048275 TaxID=3155629 RepID=UPI0033CA6D1B
MGVFARLLRRSKATEEASTAEVQADTQTADAGAEAEVAEEAKGSPESGGEAEAAQTAETTTTEDVEIPQQQTAEKAADNEAGEGARK